LAIGYYGTRDPAPVREDTVWYAFATTTYDADAAAPTFVTDQVTANQDPATIGFQDFYGAHITTDRHGRVLFAFMDQCDIRNACTTDFNSGYTANDRQISVAVQSSGRSLFDWSGVLSDLQLEPPRPAAKHAPYPGS
jgi:hypothetical protein